jgi:hypothetical protein
MLDLLPADVVLTASSGWFGKAIRFMTRRIGEAPSRVNHAGIIVSGGPVESSWIVEALRTVQHRNFWRAYRGRDKVAVYRARNLTPEQQTRIAVHGCEYIGRKYGYLKILGQALDWPLQGAYVFRRLFQMDNYPICSWVVAESYAKEGFNFGVPAGAATPDDCWDFCTKRTDLYECVLPLGTLK